MLGSEACKLGQQASGYSRSLTNIFQIRNSAERSFVVCLVIIRGFAFSMPSRLIAFIDPKHWDEPPTLNALLEGRPTGSTDALKHVLERSRDADLRAEL